MLVFDDESQHGVELVDSLQPRGRPDQAALEDLSLPLREGQEQLLFGGEPAVERGARDTGLRSDFGQAELGLAVAAEYLGGGGEDPLTRRGVGFYRLNRLAHI